jgi:hypothetical protein
MHVDRSADAAGGASCQRTTRARQGPLADAADRRVMKVAGLGAPVSVQIRFEACEGDVIADELREQITVDETAEAEARASVTSERPDDDCRRARLGEFRQMLDEIERDGGRPTEPFEVVWPTVLAYEVLRGALDVAAERLHETLKDPYGTDAIRNALNVLAASLDTWEAFRAIDNGGLQDVAL